MSSAKEPVTRRFGNGLTVLIKEDKSHPVVSLQYWVGTGSMNEGHWQGSGLSHLLEHLVFKGTEHYSGQDLARKVQERGGHWNAYTSVNRTVYYIDGPADSWQIFLNLLTELLQPRTDAFTDIPEQIDFIDALPDYDVAMYTHKKMKTNSETALAALKEILPALEGISDWTLDNINAAMFGLVEKLGVKNGYVLWPLRVAVSGKQFTPGGGAEIAELLGKEESIRRVRTGIEKLSQ